MFEEQCCKTTHNQKEKHSKIIQTMWSTGIVCVFDQTHSTPKGWADRGKDRLQKGFAVNSNTVVLGT